MLFGMLCQFEPKNPLSTRRSLKTLRYLGTQKALGHLGTHDTWALGHLGTRGTLFNRRLWKAYAKVCFSSLDIFLFRFCPVSL